ncbi:hypothetical protein ACTXT7_005957 [Hymenolepis weldensis]
MKTYAGSRGDTDCELAALRVYNNNLLPRYNNKRYLDTFNFKHIIPPRSQVMVPKHAYTRVCHNVPYALLRAKAFYSPSRLVVMAKKVTAESPSMAFNESYHKRAVYYYAWLVIAA